MSTPQKALNQYEGLVAVVSADQPKSAAGAPASLFHRRGYVVLRGFWSAQVCAELRHTVQQDLDPVVGPAEYEADVGYPGAPQTRLAPGGNTPRRLLSAYARAAAFRRVATGSAVAKALADLTVGPNDEPGSAWQLSQCHHNCVMTKYPSYSSATLWHQDIRYWSFDAPELISMWVALGHEHEGNGALRIIPGSHTLDIDRGRLDRDLFLRGELPENQALIAQAQAVELHAGDALFFHCRAFHAAGPNTTQEPKLSCVFTYHQARNRPIPETRSAAYPSVELSEKN